MRTWKLFLLLVLPFLVVLAFIYNLRSNEFEKGFISYGFVEEEVKLNNPNFDFIKTSYNETDIVSIKKGNVWVRVRLADKNETYTFRVLNRLFPKIEHFILEDNSLIKQGTSGYSIPCNVRTHCHQQFIFSCTPKTHYFRIESIGAVSNLRLKLSTQKSFIAKNQIMQIGYGLYYGVFLFFIILNVFLYQQIKQKVNLLYLMFTSALAIAFAFFDGTMSVIIFPNFALDEYYLNRSSFHLIMLLHLFFCIDYFTACKNKKWVNSLVKVFIVIQVIFILLSIIFKTNYQVSLNFASLIFLATQVILVACLIIHELTKRKIQENLFLTTYIPVGILIILYCIKILGIGLHKGSFGTMLYVCMASTVLILSIHIINSFGKYKTEATQKLIEVARIKNFNQLSLEKTVQNETKILNRNKELLLDKNKELLDSFHYAKRIQNSLLSTEATIQSIFKKSFLLFKPKRILSRDFYWFTNVQTENNPDLVLFCLGTPEQKGIPGILINAIILKTIRNSIHSQKLSNTARINNYLNNRLQVVLGKNGINISSNIFIGVYNRLNNELSFSGNKNFIQIIRNGSPLNANNFTQNMEKFNEDFTTTELTVKIKPGDNIFLSTKGISSLINSKGKHYFIQLLMRIHKLNIAEQKLIIQNELNDLYERKHEDITFISFKID